MSRTSLEKEIGKKICELKTMILEAEKPIVETTMKNVEKYNLENCNWTMYWAKDFLLHIMNDAKHIPEDKKRLLNHQ